MSYWVENGELWRGNDSGPSTYSKHRIEGVDLSTLQILNRTWAKDAKHVWGEGDKLRNVHPPAFQALNAGFGRDNECVFDCLGRVVKGLNAVAFEVLDDGLLHEDDDEYPDVGGYARCEGKIYHFDRFRHKTMLLRGADAATFEVLKWGFARDKKKVFHGVNVAKANPQTFRQITCRFSEDGQKVFYYNRIVPEADPATFEFIGGQVWAKDRHRVYCTGFGEGFVEGADVPTFQELPPQHPSRGDAWDKNWIYRGSTRWRPRSDFRE